MPYGTIKVDTVTFTDAGIDKSVSISGLVQNPTFSGNITVTGTISGGVVRGGTISGATVTGAVGNFVSGVFTSQISGATITGNVGSFTTFTGGTATFTSGVFASGTAAAPSISVGSTTNGLFSSASNQIGLATNGLGRVFVEESGRVTIGGTVVTDVNLLNIQGSTATHNVGIVLNKTNATAQIWGIQNTGPLNIFNYTASTAALAVDTSNRVHIGNTRDALANLNIYGTGGQGGGIQINRNITGNPTVGQSLGSIGFKGVASANSNAAAEALIEAVAAENHTGSTAATNLFLYTKPSGTGPGSSPQARLCIDSNGNVGIGVSGNLSRLTVGAGNNLSTSALVAFNTANADINALTLSNWTGVAATKGPRIGFDHSGVGGWTVGVADAVNAFDFTTAWGTPLVRINATGQFSVGSAPVGFNGGSISSPARGNIFYDTDGSGWQLRIGKLQSGTFTPQITIQDNGVVGFATTNPQNDISVGAIGSLNIDANSVYFGNNFTATGANFRKTGNFAQRLWFDTATNNFYFESTTVTGTAGNAITWATRFTVGSDGFIYNNTPGAAFVVSLPDNQTYYRALTSGGLGSYTQHIWFRRSTGTGNRGMKFNTYDNNGNEQIWFILDGNAGVRFPSTISTTASAANAFLDSANENQLLRSTSSLRYKTNIENIEESYSNNILNLRPVWYRSLTDHDRNDWSWYGLIAEEVAEVEPRLVHYGYTEEAYEKVRNSDGTFSDQLKADAQLVPDGVQYDRLTVLLLDVVKRQQKTIESLEARIAALESA